MIGEGKMGKVVVAGGSGFIGSALTQKLIETGREVVVLGRSGKAPSGAKGVRWDAKTLGAWSSELDGAEAVVNLTGRSVVGKWTPAVRKEILDSRVRSTEILGQAMQGLSHKPKAWVNASAIGWYGDTGSREVAEGAPVGTGFLAEVSKAWEEALDRSCPADVRGIKLRIGMVLGRDGGALPLLEKVTKAFLGGPIGSGKQWVSWIHVADLVDMIVFAIEHDVQGILNGTSPEPRTNAEFMAELRKALGRPPAPPAPAVALQMMAALGGPEPETALMSTRVYPAMPLALGFHFRLGSLAKALDDLTHDAPKAWTQPARA